MQAEAEREVRSELEDQESLIWSGSPVQGVLFRQNDWLMIPFSFVWIGFAFLMLVPPFIGEAGWFMAAPAAPMFLIGAYATFGRFLVDMHSRRRTYYGLTNQRAIVISGILSRSVKSMPLRTLTDVTLTETAGRGTISLGPQPVWANLYEGFPWPGMSTYLAPAFAHIEKARDVYNQLRSAQERAS